MSVVVLIAIAALGTSLYMATFLKQEFVPPMDRSEFNVIVQLPTGKSLSATRRYTESLAREILETPGVEEAFVSAVPDECEFLFDLSTAIAMAATGQVDAEQFSADEAPEEVRDDVETLVEAFDRYDPSDPIGSGQALASEDVRQASDNISSFVEQNCDPAFDGAG